MTVVLIGLRLVAFDFGLTHRGKTTSSGIVVNKFSLPLRPGTLLVVEDFLLVGAGETDAARFFVIVAVAPPPTRAEPLPFLLT